MRRKSVRRKAIKTSYKVISRNELLIYRYYIIIIQRETETERVMKLYYILCSIRTKRIRNADRYMSYIRILH